MSRLAIESLNFSDNETCTILANFLNTAVNLSYLDIEYQDATRPIRITVNPASDGNEGSIVISNYDDSSLVIVDMPTNKSIAVNVNYGDIG